MYLMEEKQQRDGLPGIVHGQKVDESKVLRAKELRRELTESEQKLWDCLRAHQLHGLHFRRQQVIAGFIVDFYCHKQQLVVEVDGGIHAGRSEYDCERDQVLRGLGLRVMRVRNDDVLLRLPEVLTTIVNICGLSTPSNSPSPLGEGTGGRGPKSTSAGSPSPLGEGAGGRGQPLS